MKELHKNAKFLLLLMHRQFLFEVMHRQMLRVNLIGEWKILLAAWIKYWTIF